MSELLKVIAEQDRGDESCLINPKIGYLSFGVCGGMAWALRVAEALAPRLQGKSCAVAVSGWSAECTSGLFFSDEVHGRAVRVGSNVCAGCGRAFIGALNEFEFPSRLPFESGSFEVLDFDDDGFDFVVDKIVKFFLRKSKLP